MKRYVLGTGVLLTVLVIGPAQLTAQCDECITQWTGELAEHWFGNTPDDDPLWDNSNYHDNPEPGTCDDTSPSTGDPYHPRCDLTEEDQENLEEALAALNAGRFGPAELSSLKKVVESVRLSFVTDGEMRNVYVVGCSGAVVASFQAPRAPIPGIMPVPHSGPAGSR